MGAVNVNDVHSSISEGNDLRKGLGVDSLAFRLERRRVLGDHLRHLHVGMVIQPCFAVLRYNGPGDRTRWNIRQSQYLRPGAIC